MVAPYCTYLIMSAAGNHTHATCNPLTKYAGASPLVTTQPAKKDSPRYQALVAAVEVGAIPTSALNEMDEDDEEDTAIGEEQDDERTGTRYNVRRSSPVWRSYLN